MSVAESVGRGDEEGGRGKGCEAKIPDDFFGVWEQDGIG